MSTLVDPSQTRIESQSRPGLFSFTVRISRLEWLWVFGLSALVLLFSSLPYLAGAGAQDSDLVFSGAAFDRQDYAVHLATMHLGERGEWTYRMLFTSEGQKGSYVKMAYLFLGHAARWTGLSLPVAYQLGRWAFGILACLAIYRLAADCFPEVGWRRLAFLLAVLGSGLGWLLLVVGWQPSAGISPIDFWLIDAYVFFGILVFPHFAAVTFLLAGMVSAGLSFLRSRSFLAFLLAALAGLLAQVIQPYAPVLAGVALAGAVAAHGLQQRRIVLKDWVFLAGLGAVQLPLLLYNLTVFNADPVWRAFAAQNLTLSPPPAYYLWGFGLLWLPAFTAVWKAGRKGLLSQPLAFWSALAWAAAALLLAYTPTYLQRRFMHAFSLPLALLAVTGIRDVIFPWVDRRAPDWLARRKNLLLVFGSALACLSSVYLSLGGVLYLAQRPLALFDPTPLVQAVDWLGAHASQGDVVLSAEQTGQLVAARIGLPVYLGHPIETLDYQAKSAALRTFFNGKQADRWLAATGARWLIFGLNERGLLENPHSLQLPGVWGDLQAVFQNDSVIVYKIGP